MDDNTVSIDLGPDMQWTCKLEWPEGETQGGPVKLTLEPSDPNDYPAGGISSTLLREVDFKAALDILRRQQVRSKQWQRVRAANEKRVNALLAAHAAEGAITDEYLTLLSRVYVAAVSSGQDKPLEYLAELLDKTHASIQNHLWQATRRGLLERSPGRSGGKLTAKAANLMRTVTG
jgi:hypothetical protein